VSYFRSFLIGAVFPVAWIPCTSWVLGGILLLAGTSQTAWQGAYLLAFYSLGLGLPFLILGAAFDFLMPLLKNINRYSSWIYLASGLLLIIVGSLVLTDKLGLFPGQI
jgi:cytochrome c-type biogenesis protein